MTWLNPRSWPGWDGMGVCPTPVLMVTGAPFPQVPCTPPPPPCLITALHRDLWRPLVPHLLTFSFALRAVPGPPPKAFLDMLHTIDWYHVVIQNLFYTSHIRCGENPPNFTVLGMLCVKHTPAREGSQGAAARVTRRMSHSHNIFPPSLGTINVNSLLPKTQTSAYTGKYQPASLLSFYGHPAPRPPQGTVAK